ncbi:putative hemolysin [Sulfitobacter undariae]|uniref:L-ornithine N(alpha)-acyltransferase n=1 Tax=Sulfitobacter undariae TaxID=1563671 RepID=A0A7W6GZG1_9RHOB|nr:GNAT family N-acetyltransferase [Sulfitobacter undariae]MBB3993886.1 putative hemolysin [Sulfitobacter undariae]
MTPLRKGRYIARAVQGRADMEAVFALRGICFGDAGGIEDAFDETAVHGLVEEAAEGGAVVATFRMSVSNGARISQTYCAQYYDLTALEGFEGAMLELGRFCIHPAHPDPDILRIAWAALTAHVDAHGIDLLFGCTSFKGTNPALYLDALSLLKERHQAPERWAPKVKSVDVFPYAETVLTKPDMKKATATLPPLLRTYLLMGGWVSDHAVIDYTLNTLHVFTGLEIGAIPPARKKLLRALV